MGTGCERNRELGYHVYMNFKDMGSKNAVAHAYDQSTHSDVHKKRRVIQGNMNPLYMSDGKKGTDNDVSSSIFPAEMTGKGTARVL